jgi:hypothetical protein
VHEVASVEAHVSVEVPPVDMSNGLALKVAVGTMLTVTVAAVLVPPAPLQVIEKVAALVSAPVL